jgi:hypothetical protein
MSSSTYGGIMRELPILPFPTMSISLARGMVVQWGAISQSVGAWTSGANVPLGVCTGDVDRDSGQVAVYVGKGASVSIKCAPGIIPNPNDFLFWGAVGLVSNVSDGNPPFAREIGVGFNGYVEAIVI